MGGIDAAGTPVEGARVVPGMVVPGTDAPGTVVVEVVTPVVGTTGPQPTIGGLGLGVKIGGPYGTGCTAGLPVHQSHQPAEAVEVSTLSESALTVNERVNQ